MIQTHQPRVTSVLTPLSTAELLNPDPRWARLEMLRLLDDFWRSRERADALRPTVMIFANILLLGLAASFNKAWHAPAYLPRVRAAATHPTLHAAVTDFAPNETIAHAFAALCGMIVEEGARRLELVDLAAALPALHTTASATALGYLAHDADLHPGSLLRRCHAVTGDLVGGDLVGALHGLRRLTDELTTAADSPLLLQPDRFGAASTGTCLTAIAVDDTGSGRDTAATIQRLMASLRRLQARQKDLQRAFDLSSPEAIETRNQIGFLFGRIANLKRSRRSAAKNQA